MKTVITLKTMTRPLCHQFFRDFHSDPDILTPNQPFIPYHYTYDGCDAYFERQRNLERIHLAICLDEKPIGEIIMKNIDRHNGHCRLSIHMQSDAVKNKGYGTTAEKLALLFAFTELNMNTVFADALATNTRSRHVLQKAGFHLIHADETYCYFSCSNPGRTDPELL